jgi:hypothetical protein
MIGQEEEAEIMELLRRLVEAVEAIAYRDDGEDQEQGFTAQSLSDVR